MKRQLVVAFALVASLLVVTAMPAAAAHQLTNVSVNDTAADFNAGTLTNMSISGSGASATVELASSNAVDTFEDGDISEYSGDTGSFTVQNTVLIDGQWTLKGETGASGGAKTIISTSGLGSYPSAGDANFSQTVRLTETDDIPEVSFGVQDANNRYTVILHAQSDEIRIFKVSGGSGTELNAVSAPLSSNLNENLTVTIDWDTDGSITTTVEDESGSSLGSVSASDTTWSSGGIGFVVNTADAATRTMYFDGLTVGLPGEYINTHSANDTTAGFVHVTSVNNVSFDVNITGDADGDGVYETTLNLTTGLTTAANHSFTWTEFSDSAIQVDIDVTSTGTSEAFVLEREGVQATGVAPSVDNTSASPTGGLTTSTPTLEIDVNDSDFPDAQGDSVEVEFYVDGASVGTDTLTANGTATLTASALSGGDHTWHVVANDTYGHSTTSQTFDISTPANITIRNESDPHGIIDSVTVEAIIAGTGQTVDVQSTTNGNISLAGLPTDEEYIFVLEADGFHTRTVIVEDVFAQDVVFLLNTNLTSIENTFVLDDQTGQFEGDNVTLIIQRPINRSVYDSTETEEFQWTDIAGDRTGAAEEFTVDLEKEKRFRIIVDNNEGDRRVLGEYQAETAGSVTLNIGELTFDVGADGATYEYDASFTSSNVKFNYTDPDDTTSSLTVKIFESGNASNEIYNQTHTDLGTLSVTQALSGDEENETWVVEFSGTRDGESIAGSVVVGASDLSPGVPLDDAWKTRIAFSLLLVLTGLTAGGINAETGTVVAALSGGVLWWSGWLPAAIGGGVVALALFVAAALTLSTRGGEEIQ